MSRSVLLSRFRHAVLGVAILVGTALSSPHARAQISVDITQGQIEPIPVAIVRFQIGKNVPLPLVAQAQQWRDTVVAIISSNLNHSGIFRIIPEAAHPTTFLPMDALPSFDQWQQIGAQAVITGEVSAVETGGVIDIGVTYRVWDVLLQQQLDAARLSAQDDGIRRIAHKISDAIYSAHTGEPGYFDSRIVYIAESGPRENRIKRLAVMDQDGANNKLLTDGKDIILNPRFSKSQQLIAFIIIENKEILEVRILNILTGKVRSLGNFQGLSFAPRFSPDDKTLAYSIAKSGNTDIWLIDIRTMKRTRLTFHPGIDTSPSFSPDGRQIVWTSDRSGRANLYIMDVNGTNKRRISFGSGSYSTPNWSPRGDLIAFTNVSGGLFGIGVMRPDGSQERLLDRAFHVEGPSWAPNGRVLTYFREFEDSRGNFHARLLAINLNGQSRRLLRTPSDASDPTWSPLLP